MKKLIMFFVVLFIGIVFINVSYSGELKELKVGNIDVVGEVHFFHDQVGGGYMITTDKNENILIGYVFDLPDTLQQCFDKYEDKKVRIQGKRQVIKNKGIGGTVFETVEFNKTVKCTPVK